MRSATRGHPCMPCKFSSRRARPKDRPAPAAPAGHPPEPAASTCSRAPVSGSRCHCSRWVQPPEAPVACRVPGDWRRARLPVPPPPAGAVPSTLPASRPTPGRAWRRWPAGFHLGCGGDGVVSGGVVSVRPWSDPLRQRQAHAQAHTHRRVLSGACTARWECRASPYAFWQLAVEPPTHTLQLTNLCQRHGLEDWGEQQLPMVLLPFHQLGQLAACHTARRKGTGRGMTTGSHRPPQRARPPAHGCHGKQA